MGHVVGGFVGVVVRGCVAALLLMAAAQAWAPGDVNHDGAVTSADAELIVHWVIGAPVSIDTALADMSGDGDVTAYDATLVLRAVASGCAGVEPARLVEVKAWATSGRR